MKIRFNHTRVAHYILYSESIVTRVIEFEPGYISSGIQTV